MKKILAVLSFMASAAWAFPTSALEVFSCDPQWGALTQELGGEHVSIYYATNALQDPHQIQAKPSLLAKARAAQLVVCTGAELEIGWMPVVLRHPGNAAVQPGRPGYFAAADYVQKLEAPTALDRAAGDVHAAGNPHIQTDPRNIAKVAAALAQRLAQIDPANAEQYRARYADFSARWNAAIARWEQEAAPLKGVAIVAHHRSWPYLCNWLGLREVAELEPKPGVEPTAAQLQAVLAGAMLLTYTERRWPEVQEALIGVLFVLAACAGLLLLANNPHGGEHLKDLLVGQILWVNMHQLLPVAALSALVRAGGDGGGAIGGRVSRLCEPHHPRAREPVPATAAPPRGGLPAGCIGIWDRARALGLVRLAERGGRGVDARGVRRGGGGLDTVTHHRLKAAGLVTACLSWR